MAQVYPMLTRRGFLLPSRLQASYDAAGTGRRSKTINAPGTGPATASITGLGTLRRRSHAAARNNPYAFSVIDRLVSNTIGTGIVPKPKHKVKEIRVALQELWDDWGEEADADGITDIYGLEALVCRTVCESGECFIRLRPRRLSDGLSVPLQVQVLEPEFVPYEKNELLSNGNQIMAGIELNAIGQRVAYWMYLSHPGDSGTAPAGTYNKLVRIPADQVLHIYEPRPLHGNSSIFCEE